MEDNNLVVVKMVEAELSDLDNCVSCTRDYFKEIQKHSKHHSFDTETVKKRLYILIQSEESLVVLAKYKEQIRGMAIVSITPTITDLDNIMAVEVVWHTSTLLPREERLTIMQGLKFEMEQWAIEKGAKSIMIGAHAKTVIPSLLKNDGYYEGNVSMIKELS